MTHDEATWLLTNWKNPLVRIAPNARHKPSGTGTHYMRGRLLNVFKTRAVVQPMGHKKPEEIEFEYLKPWSSKMPEEIRNGFNKFPSINLNSEKEKEMFKPEAPNKTYVTNGVVAQPATMVNSLKSKSGLKRITQNEKLEFIRLWEMGKTQTEISIITKKSQSAVSRWIIRHKQAVQKAQQKEQKRQSSEQFKKVASQIGEEPKLVAPRSVEPSKATLAHAIRTLLSLNIPDTSKLLAIEGLVSHE